MQLTYNEELETALTLMLSIDEQERILFKTLPSDVKDRAILYFVNKLEYTEYEFDDGSPFYEYPILIYTTDSLRISFSYFFGTQLPYCDCYIMIKNSNHVHKLLHYVRCFLDDK